MPTTRRTVTWTHEAHEAIRTKLRGPYVSVVALERLAEKKRQVLAAKPAHPTGLDDGLSSILGDQVRALDILAAVLREKPFNRSQLEELTMREAYRLKRTDILAGTFDHLTIGTGSPS